jgi:predicted nuclease of predicted toxin-antitoxin system
MRILLDECVPRRLRNHLPQHECQTAQRAGFGGLENGELLEAAENAERRVSTSLRQVLTEFIESFHLTLQVC